MALFRNRKDDKKNQAASAPAAMDAKEIEKNANFMGRTFIKGLDRAVRLQSGVIRAYVDHLRRSNPEASPAEIQELMDKHFMYAASGTGAGAGGAAAVPGIGFFTGAAAVAGESLVFVDLAAVYTVGSAYLRGVDISDAERRRAIVLMVLSGSQGAAIVGDVANSVGTNQGPVAADKILGVVPLADPRRENGVGQHPGLPLQGTGAEIALRQVQPVVDLAAPGVSLRGPRQGGFGSLNERVFEICAPDDVVCDTPVDLMAAFARLQQILSNPEVHGQYGTNPNSVPGTTAGAWILDWSKKLIDGAK